MRNIRKILLLISLSLTSYCFTISPPRAGDHPWLTGPLITPSARVVPKGHVNLEPYLFYTVVNGIYDSHWHANSIPNFYQANPQIVAKVGLIDRVNFSIVFQSVYNRTRGVSGRGFGDLPIGFDIALIKPEDSKFPLKISIQEIIPIGKYDRLNPKKFDTDVSGFGSYTTILALTVGHIHHFCGDHYLNLRINVSGGVPAPAFVKGKNIYGGDATTHGKVFPGLFYTINFGAEYTLTKNWALAMDLVGQVFGRDRFKGNTITPVGLPTFVQINMAPAIEYNFNKSIGLIVGTNFTLAGKNAARFISAVAALNWYF